MVKKLIRNNAAFFYRYHETSWETFRSWSYPKTKPSLMLVAHHAFVYLFPLSKKFLLKKTQA